MDEILKSTIVQKKERCRTEIAQLLQDLEHWNSNCSKAWWTLNAKHCSKNVFRFARLIYFRLLVGNHCSILEIKKTLPVLERCREVLARKQLDNISELIFYRARIAEQISQLYLLIESEEPQEFRGIERVLLNRSNPK
jgi:hypothetical protein